MSEPVIQIHDVRITQGAILQDRYRIVRHLGEGGFAQVFEAFDTNIERSVAIKFLNLHTSTTDQSASDNMMARFKREAKLAARIQHPNVVNIFDFGILGQNRNIPFIVMELLSGHDLEEQIFEKGPMSPQRALPLFVGCLEALGEAHKLGIVHKDLKPSNLFLSNPGERNESLRIVDFGIAHIRDAREGRLTATGEILGTPQYLSPEYIEAQIVTPAFDVYQMGLILVEALTGRPVVDENHPLRCVKVHSMGELDLPTPLLESPLGPVIAKALHIDHTQRFADADAFADALAAVDATTLPKVGPDTPMARLSSAGTLDSNSRLMATGTGTLRQPTTGQLNTGATQQGYAQPQLGAPADQSGGISSRATAQHARNGAGPTDQVPRSTAAAINNAGLGSKKGVKALVALGILVLVLGGVAAWLVTNRLSGAKADENPAEATASNDNDPAAAAKADEAAAADKKPAAAVAAAATKQDKAADNAGDAKEAKTPPAADKKEPVEVTVDSSPAGATVYRGSTKLGDAPVAVKFDSKDADAVTIKLSRDGYEDKEVSVSPDAGDNLQVALERVPHKTHHVTRHHHHKPHRVAKKETPTKPTKPAKTQKKDDNAPRMLIAP